MPDFADFQSRAALLGNCPQPGCVTQTVRNAIHAFEQRGLACLKPESCRPKTVQAQFDQARCEALRALLHQNPRTFGKASSIWTLELAVEVLFFDVLHWSFFHKNFSRDSSWNEETFLHEKCSRFDLEKLLLSCSQARVTSFPCVIMATSLFTFSLHKNFLEPEISGNDREGSIFPVDSVWGI